MNVNPDTHEEEVFTLGMESDRGYYAFLSMQGNCYLRDINGEHRTSCYRKVNY